MVAWKAPKKAMMFCRLCGSAQFSAASIASRRSSRSNLVRPGHGAIFDSRSPVHHAFVVEVGARHVNQFPACFWMAAKPPDGNGRRSHAMPAEKSKNSLPSTS